VTGRFIDVLSNMKSLFGQDKPHVAFLADTPHWAFDTIAISLRKRLRENFRVSIHHVARSPRLNPQDIDILFVHFWGETSYTSKGFSRKQIIKDVASWRWKDEEKFGRMDADEFSATYLNDCICVTTPCAAIYNELRSSVPNLCHCPNGVEASYFAFESDRKVPLGPLKIGWVGNPCDSLKGLEDVLKPAARNYQLYTASGSLSKRKMREFYKSIDVLAISSKSESQPLPLLESMAAGCFPVTTNVGIVPEILTTGYNGLVVERSVESFQSAFSWCAENVEMLRAQREQQTHFAHTQTWDRWVSRYTRLFDAVLACKDADMFKLPADLADIVVRDPDLRTGVNESINVATGGCSALRWEKICYSLDDLREYFRRWWLGDRFTQGFSRRCQVCLSRILKRPRPSVTGPLERR